MRVAVVTLAVGQAFVDRWRLWCEPNWRAYCTRHGYDLVVIDQALDTSPRAQSRSPSWQKCLILRHDDLAAYDRVVWVDGDVVINPAAPPITSDVPIEKIGAVDELALPTPELHQRIIKLLVDHWRSSNPSVSDNWAAFLDPADWHAFAGLPRRGKHIIQAGVLVLSPRYHRALLEHVYNAYEDLGAGMNYEMRALSFEIQDNGLQHLLDSRFNQLIYLLAWESELVLNRKLSVREALARNYFLHFCGGLHFLNLMNLLTEERIARNAPCPCGSGKRYKHCHGRYA